MRGAATAERAGVAAVLLLGAAGLGGCGDREETPGPETRAGEEVAVPDSVDPLLQRGECLSCHRLEGEGIDLGPPLTRVGARMSRDDIRAKILAPTDFASEGYENLAGLMPSDFGDRFEEDELELLVETLSRLR